MNRLNRSAAIAFCALVSITSCAANNHVVTQQGASETRADILARDVYWILDSVPVLRFATPDSYGAYRVQLERCSGRTREGWPAFFVAPIAPIPAPHEPRGGFYVRGIIVFALGYEVQPWAIRHEILHWLLEPIIPPAPDGETYEEMKVRTHPAEYFAPEGKCGVYVIPKAE